MQCLPVKLQVSGLGAESAGRCSMTLEAVQDIERGFRMLGNGEDCKMSACEKQAFTALLTNCSFPEGSKTLLLLKKITKFFLRI